MPFAAHGACRQSLRPTASMWTRRRAVSIAFRTTAPAWTRRYRDPTPRSPGASWRRIPRVRGKSEVPRMADPQAQPAASPEHMPLPGAGAARSAEANKAVVRRVYEEGLGAGNLAVLDELLGEALIDHSLFPGRETGRESFKR